MYPNIVFAHVETQSEQSSQTTSNGTAFSVDTIHHTQCALAFSEIHQVEAIRVYAKHSVVVESLIKPRIQIIWLHKIRPWKRTCIAPSVTPSTTATISASSPMYLVIGVKVRVDDARVWVRLGIHNTVVDVRLGINDDIVHIAFGGISTGGRRDQRRFYSATYRELG